MYIFEKITKEDGDIFASWLDDKRINKWVSGIDNWYKYFEWADSEPNQFLIKVLFEDKIIGEISLEIIDETGYISYMINPDEQSKGHGKKILNLFLSQISLIINKKIKHIEAGVSPDNIASKSCFESCGFEFKEIDEDGFIDYIYNLENK